MGEKVEFYMLPLCLPENANEIRRLFAERCEEIQRLQSLIDEHNRAMDELCGNCPQRQKGRECLDCMRRYKIEG